MPKRLKVTILGQVQGVFYRYNVKLQAEKFGLSGWVKNKADGSVELVAEGEEEKLKKFLDYCQAGPPFAQVEKVEVSWAEATGEFGQNFKFKFYDN